MIRLIAFLALLASFASAQISYLDFSSTAGLTLNPNSVQSGTALRVSSSALSDKGSAWFSTPVAVAQGFDTAFIFQITGLVGGGGDGMAFVIQNDPRGTAALGNHASALGYAKFTNTLPGVAIANSLAIEIDTFSNNFAVGPDLSSNQISIHTNGTAENDRSEAFSLGAVTPAINMKDGQPHMMRIRYVPGTLDVFLDDVTTPVLSVLYDFATGGTHYQSGTPVGGLSLLSAGQAIVGFTASGGGSYENHDVLSWQTPPWEWQMNSASSSLTVNGLPDPGPLAPITQLSAVAQIDTLNMATTGVGLPWDLAISLPGQPVGLSAGGFPVPGGQSFNLSLFSGTTFFLNGGVLPNLTTTAFPVPTLNIPFSFPTPLQLGIQMINIDPTSPVGLALSHAIDYSTVTCSTQQDFDALPTGTGVYPIAWSNGGGTREWTVHTGGTTSSATGPTSASSLPNYMYCETSSPVLAGDTFIVDTCTMDASLLSSFTLNFSLSRIGVAIGTLNVWQDDGTGTFPILLATYAGADPTQAQNGVEWSAESLPFTPTPTVTGQFRFEYIAGVAGQSTFSGDIAIDDIVLQ